MDGRGAGLIADMPPALPPPMGAGAAALEEGAAAADAAEAIGPGPIDWLAAPGFREAVRLLEDVHDRRPIDHLVVMSRVTHGQVQIEFERDGAPSFRRFVALLGQREGGRNVRQISFLTKWSGLPDDDMETLFGNVLPSHRTLQRIDVVLRRLPTKFLRLLLESIPTAEENSLSSLRIGGWGRDPETNTEEVQAIADMLKRNVKIEHLAVHLDLDADKCKIICQALPRNTNLRDLELRVREVFADTLEGVATSSLLRLHVDGNLSEDTVSSITRQLRTNTTLRDLRLGSYGVNVIRDPRALGLVLDFAKTYNYTLHTLDVESRHPGTARARGQLRAHMRRNRRIRDAFEDLQDPDSRLVVPPRLLPRVLGLVSALPTALYRILRMGYVNAVSDLLAKQMMVSTTTTTTVEAREPLCDPTSPSWGARERQPVGEVVIHD